MAIIGQKFYGYGEHVLVRIIAYNSRNRQDWDTDMLYTSMYPQRYVDVYSISVFQSHLRSFLCNPYITLQIS